MFLEFCLKVNPCLLSESQTAQLTEQAQVPGRVKYWRCHAPPCRRHYLNLKVQKYTFYEQVRVNALLHAKQ